MPNGPESSMRHIGRWPLDFERTLELGVNLLELFANDGHLPHLFNSISLLRECLLLCPDDRRKRILAVGNLSAALLLQCQLKTERSYSNEAISRCYEVLELCSLNHPKRFAFLNNLSAALLIQYNREGRRLDLAEAIEQSRKALSLRPRGHSERAKPLQNLCHALVIQYKDTGCLSDLSEAIEWGQEALDLCPRGNPDRAASLRNLSDALFTQYTRTGDASDLAKAIEQCREALGLCPPRHPDHDVSHDHFTKMLTARCQHAGQRLSDFTEALEHCREALTFRPPGHPSHGASLHNLSIVLIARYELSGSLSDLEEGIEQYRKALNCFPPSDPNRATTLAHLSGALVTRYKHAGNLQDLTEAIGQCREALNLCPPGHPNRTVSLSGLSSALLTRYQSTGSPSDLAEAIEQRQEELSLRPPGHPDHAISLLRLTNALLSRYKSAGNFSDLTVVIEQYREVLNLHPPGHPGRATTLSNLSDALVARHKHTGSVSDLAEAVEWGRESLNLRPSGHPDRLTSLHNLSNALGTRYRHSGNLSDLVEAIEQQREVLNLYQPGNLDRAGCVNNLSASQYARYQREERISDLVEAIELQREALNLRPPGHPARGASLNNLSAYLFVRYQRGGSSSDVAEAIERYREALSLFPSDHPSRDGCLINLSTALCARFERERNVSDLTEAIEGYREALSLSPSGHPARVAALNNFAGALMTRYKCEDSPSDLAEAVKCHREALNLLPPDHPDRSQFLSSLAQTLLHTINTKGGAPAMHSYWTFNEVFGMIREAVNLSTSPPLHRLQVALQWIDKSRLALAPKEMLGLYAVGLEQLDTVLATSSTLENKHMQLSSEELTRCRRLGVEAASYAVSQGYMVGAVELLERGRNLLFAQIGRYRVDLEDLQKENVKLAERFSNLSGLLDASVVSNQPTLEGRTAFEEPVERYRRVASDWSQVVDDIRGLEGFKNFLRPPDYATLRAAAAEGPIIIIIPSAGQSDALIVSQGCEKPHHVVLPGATEAELADLRSSLIHAVGDNDERATEKSVKKILGSLWDLVVSPIADALEDELHIPRHSRIWWCPTSLFSFLPLHAAGRYARKDTDRNLPDRYVSSYTPTLLALVRARRNRNDNKVGDMLILAQPDTPNKRPLPRAQEEAKSVEGLVEAMMKTTLISSQGGTHTAVLDGMASHSWLHLICHGIQNSSHPFDSCFCLYDGKLTLQDIIQSGLPDARFAFLAACHTATGDDTLLDEGLHLAAGLQFAGFKGVVGTIWKVADEDGPLIAQAFYKALQEERCGERGSDCSRPAYALSRAVKQLRAEGVVKVNSWMRFIHIGI